MMVMLKKLKNMKSGTFVLLLFVLIYGSLCVVNAYGIAIDGGVSRELNPLMVLVYNHSGIIGLGAIWWLVVTISVVCVNFLAGWGFDRLSSALSFSLVFGYEIDLVNDVVVTFFGISFGITFLSMAVISYIITIGIFLVYHSLKLKPLAF